MASSITIHCQHNSNFLHRNHSFAPSDHHNNARVGPSSVSISWHFDVSKWKKWTIRSVDSVNSHHSGMAVTKKPMKRFFDDGDDNKTAAVVYEKLDKWMQNSVVEIVKNLKEAPLLVHVYDKGSETTTLKTEKSVEEENWKWVRDKWGRKETPVPEGVIFVEQLMDRDGKQQEEEEVEGITRAWGVVVQGKGVECAPVCYLLKTSRVAAAGSGLLGGGGGVCCTHYCLMRVQNFRESALSQLKNCWLVRG